MSIWSDISRFLSEVATDVFSTVVDSVRTAFEGNVETRKRVSFSIAIIALSAKMAKADGIVTEDEVLAFQEIFSVPPDEIDNVARLYNLAKQDVAGFDSYGRQVRSLFPGDDPADSEILHDVLDALFHIAKADGVIHENELLFLEDTSVLFGFDALEFNRMKLRHVGDENCNPYDILHAQEDWSYEQLKKQYRKRVSESHPDRLIARGVPPEFVLIANDRLAAINRAWEIIQAQNSTTRKTVIA